MTERNADEADDARTEIASIVAFGRRALRFWHIVAIAVAVGGIACAVYLVLRKPAYRSETVILYSEGVRTPDDEEQPENARSVAVRFKEMLMSRASLDTVVREFDLYPDVRRTRGPVDAVEELRKHVEYRAPGGDTFSIAFTGSSPTESQRVTSRLAELVVGRDTELRKARAVVTRDFLEGEESRTEADLRDKEQALAAFMGAHPRFAFDATPQATGAAFRASLGGSGPNRGAPSTFTPRDEKGAGAASGASIVGTGSSAGSSGEEARAAAALAAARTNLAELMTRFTPAHPDVRAAAAEVERAESRLATANGSASQDKPSTASSESSARPLPAVAARPVPRPAPAAPVASGVNEPGAVALETEWVKLTRAVTEARLHQDQIEAALFKASVAASSETGGHGVQVTVIDPAFLPEKPVPPGRAAILGMFAATSVVLGVIGAILFALFDDRVHASRDVVRLLPVLVEVPRATPRRAHATR